MTIDEDLDRLAVNLEISEGVLISDRDSFDLALNKYLVTNNLSSGSKEKLFSIYQSNNRDTVSKERLHEKAGGKSLVLDRMKTAQTVVKTKEEYIKRGARRVDFAGFDIKEEEIRKLKLRPPKEFNIAGTVRSKVVFAKRISIIVKGKSVVRFRDQFGRFVSVK